MPNSVSNRASVLHALNLLQTAAQRVGVEPHHLAEKKRAAAVTAGDSITATIWRDVWVTLMTQKYPTATPRTNAPTVEQNRLDRQTTQLQ